MANADQINEESDFKILFDPHDYLFHAGLLSCRPFYAGDLERAWELWISGEIDYGTQDRLFRVELQ